MKRVVGFGIAILSAAITMSASVVRAGSSEVAAASQPAGSLGREPVGLELQYAARPPQGFGPILLSLSEVVRYVKPLPGPDPAPTYVPEQWSRPIDTPSPVPQPDLQMLMSQNLTQ